MNVATRDNLIEMSGLVPALDPRATCPRALAEDDRYHLLQQLEDISFALEAASERQSIASHDDQNPDRVTRHYLSLARRTAFDLVGRYDHTSWWARFLRLRGLVCAAEIVADTFHIAKDCGSFEECALLQSIETAKDFAEALSKEAGCFS